MFFVGFILMELSTVFDGVENAYIFFWIGIVILIIGLILTIVSGEIKRLIEIITHLF